MRFGKFHLGTYVNYLLSTFCALLGSHNLSDSKTSNNDFCPLYLDGTLLVRSFRPRKNMFISTRCFMLERAKTSLLVMMSFNTLTTFTVFTFIFCFTEFFTVHISLDTQFYFLFHNLLRFLYSLKYLPTHEPFSCAKIPWCMSCSTLYYYFVIFFRFFERRAGNLVVSTPWRSTSIRSQLLYQRKNYENVVVFIIQSPISV